MKKILAPFFFLLVLSLPLACQNGFPFDHATSISPPPPNPLFISITITSPSVPAAVTIAPGGSVELINQLYVPFTSDFNFQQEGPGFSCLPDLYIPTGAAGTMTFPTAGSFDYHETLFSPVCNNGCDDCTGFMAGDVVVQ